MPSERLGYIGLGSNQGDREAHLRIGLEDLAKRGVEPEAVSSLYETEPVGDYEGAQPDFLNAVARVRTALEPIDLLAACKEIEVGRGRELDGPHHGPRPLDLDVLTLGELEVESERLTIPHPAIRERRFVLEPLLELDPAATLPGGEPLAAVLAALDSGGVRRLGPLR
jgi:2-amino-4-hydroxy-6-hydroxymethyldihydropteridine diphosphokinase